MYLTSKETRGVSSAGRAPALQAGGHRFDPGTLHQKKYGVPDKAQRSGFVGERRNKATGEYLMLASNAQIVDLISTIWANSSAG